MKYTIVAVLFSGVFSSVGCDGVEDESELSSLDLEKPDESTPHSGEPLDPAKKLKNPHDPAEGPSGGVTVPPAYKTCCVSCQGDGKTVWYNLGLKYGRCNDDGKAFCHANNWDFGNAEWYFKCPQS